ncbi:MAG: pilin protein MshC [Burkholderiales bacterium]
MRARGFTLVEMVVTLVIVGILAVVAIPRFFDRPFFDATAFADRARSMLGYAQKLAVAQNRNVFVRLDGASIALCFDSACTDVNRAIAPSGENSGSAATLAACAGSTAWFCEAIPSGTAYVAAPAIASFYFSPLGVPYLPADPFPASGFPGVSANSLVITMSGGGAARSVSVEKETGYVR